MKCGSTFGPLDVTRKFEYSYTLKHCIIYELLNLKFDRVLHQTFVQNYRREFFFDKPTIFICAM